MTDSETPSWCMGLQYAGRRTLAPEEREIIQAKFKTFRIKAACIKWLIGLIFFASLVLVFIDHLDAAGIAAGVAFSLVASLIGIAGDNDRLSQGLPLDLAEGNVRQFTGPAIHFEGWLLAFTGSATNIEPLSPVTIDVLPHAQAVWKINGEVTSLKGEASQSKDTPESVAHLLGLSFDQARGLPEQFTTLAHSQRDLLPTERTAFLRHSRKILFLDSLLTFFITFLLTFLVSANEPLSVFTKPHFSLWPLLTSLSISSAVTLMSAVPNYKHMWGVAKDKQSAHLAVLHIPRTFFAHSSSALLRAQDEQHSSCDVVVEFLPTSRLLWSIDGKAAKWRDK